MASWRRVYINQRSFLRRDVSGGLALIVCSRLTRAAAVPLSLAWRWYILCCDSLVLPEKQYTSA